MNSAPRIKMTPAPRVVSLKDRVERSGDAGQREDVLDHDDAATM